MKKSKALFVSLLLVSLFSSFTLKPDSSKSTFCGPWIDFYNYGPVTVETVDIDNGNIDHSIYDLTTGNNDFSHWDIGVSWFSVKVKLAAGQNGSIKVYDALNNVILCEPTFSGTQIYRFDFPIQGCIIHRIEVSTSSC